MYKFSLILLLRRSGEQSPQIYLGFTDSHFKFLLHHNSKHTHTQWLTIDIESISSSTYQGPKMETRHRYGINQEENAFVNSGIESRTYLTELRGRSKNKSGVNDMD